MERGEGEEEEEVGEVLKMGQANKSNVCAEPQMEGTRVKNNMNVVHRTGRC